MAKAFQIEVRGLKQLQDKFKRLPKEIQEDIAEELRTGAALIEQDAKTLAPRNKAGNGGTLVQSINSLGSGLSWRVIAKAKYSPYVEFGTGSRVRVPSGVQSYAAQFKGSGRRKNNSLAQPFLFPALFKNKPLIYRNIREALNRTLK